MVLSAWTECHWAMGLAAGTAHLACKADAKRRITSTRLDQQPRVLEPEVPGAWQVGETPTEFDPIPLGLIAPPLMKRRCVLAAANRRAFETDVDAKDGR